MPEIMVDSSTLIALDNIDQIDLLRQVYGEIWISDVVLEEFGKDVESWFRIETVENQIYAKILSQQIDSGEASLLALAFEMEDPLLVLDDKKARRVARNLGLKYTGLLGVILKADSIWILWL